MMAAAAAGGAGGEAESDSAAGSSGSGSGGRLVLSFDSGLTWDTNTARRWGSYRDGDRQIASASPPQHTVDHGTPPFGPVSPDLLQQQQPLLCPTARAHSHTQPNA